MQLSFNHQVCDTRLATETISRALQRIGSVVITFKIGIGGKGIKTSRTGQHELSNLTACTASPSDLDQNWARKTGKLVTSSQLSLFER
jgi:hypothetical protein